MTFASNPTFNDLMVKVAATMNIKKHVAGLMADKVQTLHAPCDIEGVCLSSSHSLQLASLPLSLFTCDPTLAILLWIPLILHFSCRPLREFFAGHKGTDGRFYLIDFSRAFPPTAPSAGNKEKNAFLYQLFRPEFVARCDNLSKTAPCVIVIPF